MSVVNHFGLPEEVFEIILHQLDLADVLSCSLVCIGWHNAVNSDRIWEMLCKKYISEDRLKLKIERKRVTSSYEVCESENLPRMCLWRRRYMDDVDFKRNWKNGRFQEDIVCEFDSSTLLSLDRLETDDELLLVPKGEWLMSSPYTVFNILNNPVMTGKLHLPLEDHVLELFKLSNNILVIVQQALLQVYVKDADKNFKLKFFALFDRDNSETISDTRDLLNWYNTQNGCNSTNVGKCLHNGKYFVGMCSGPDNAGVWCSTLHIWDLESQNKIQKLAFPWQMPREQLEYVSFFLRYNTVHVILAYRNCTKIQTYVIGKSGCNEIVLQLKSGLKCKLFAGTFALMQQELPETKFILFDLRDGRVLDTLKNKYRIEDYTVQGFGNLISYAEIGHFGEFTPTVTVYDAEKLCVKDKFQIECEHATVFNIHIVVEDIVLISRNMQVFIRDMNKHEVLHTLEGLDFLLLDPLRSKMVVLKPDNKLVILHFW